jgi:hypothetical protein
MATSEELKYFIALKDVINGKMGPWQCYDRWHDPEDDTTGIVLPGQVRYFRDPADEDHNLIRLPLPVDPENPERGLWGMIDWSVFIAETENKSGRLSMRLWGHPRPMIHEWPTLALLKALAWQKGIEVTP